MKNKFDLKCPLCKKPLSMITDGFHVTFDKYNNLQPSAISLAVCYDCNKKMRLAIPIDLGNIKYTIRDIF